MSDTSSCLIIAASHRADSLNRKLATLAQEELHRAGLQSDAPSYAAFDLPLFNDALRLDGAIPEALVSIADRMQRANALLIAAPEYNWSYPGSLKNILDWVSHLSPCPLAGKAALLMSASPSRRGGVMGVSHLKTVLESLGMYVFPSSFLLPEAHTAFDDADALCDAAQKTKLHKLVNEFTMFAKSIATCNLSM